MKTHLQSIFWGAVCTLGIVSLLAAGAPMAPTQAHSADYARAGFSAGVRVRDIGATSVRVDCYGLGAGVTLRGPNAMAYCWASDPSATIGAQGAASTADDVVMNSVSYDSCNGAWANANEPIDMIADLSVLSNRPKAWTGNFCTRRLATPHGSYYPACRTNTDCTSTLGLAAGTTCTRTDTQDACVHLIGIEAGTFEAASAWR